MRRQATLLCLAAVAFTAACADDPTAPAVSPTVTRPSFAAGGNSSSNVHFISASAALNPSPTLAVSFKIAGVGSGQTINVTAAAEANRTDACVNGGTNVPSDRKKTSTTQLVSLTQPVTATAGGSVVATFSLTFPGSTLSCPSGQVATLFAGSWSDVSVSTPNPSGGATLSQTIPGTFTIQ
jgi:hypothetical protein